MLGSSGVDAVGWMLWAAILHFPVPVLPVLPVRAAVRRLPVACDRVERRVALGRGGTAEVAGRRRCCVGFVCASARGALGIAELCVGGSLSQLIKLRATLKYMQSRVEYSGLDYSKGPKVHTYMYSLHLSRLDRTSKTGVSNNTQDRHREGLYANRNHWRNR
jgi:hypothetical protein